MGKKLLLLLLLAALLCGFSLYLEQPRHWVYDPATLQAIAQTGIAAATRTHGPAATPSQVIEAVLAELLAVYPATTRSTGRWLWNNAGGAMGAMTVLHCSFSEYLILFGTATGTEGHTGRHLADDYFTILYGEQWAALPGPAAREVYRAGDQHWMRRGVAKQYRMPDTCWALEYARGNIVSMLFFGYMDAIFSTLDGPTMWQTVRESAGNMIPNLLRGKV